MANIPLIIIAILIAFMLFNLIKNLIFKTAKSGFFIIISIIIIIILFMGGLTLYDLTDISTKFPNSPKLFLLNDQGKILTAAVLKDISDPDSATFPTGDYISQLKDLFLKNNFKDILSGHWRVFLVNEKAFDNIDKSLGQDKEGNDIDKNRAIELIRSGTRRNLIGCMVSMISNFGL